MKKLNQVASVGNEATNVNSETHICLNCVEKREISYTILPLLKMQIWNEFFEIVLGSRL